MRPNGLELPPKSGGINKLRWRITAARVSVRLLRRCPHLAVGRQRTLPAACRPIAIHFLARREFAFTRHAPPFGGPQLQPFVSGALRSRRLVVSRSGIQGADMAPSAPLERLVRAQTTSEAIVFLFANNNPFEVDKSKRH